MPDLDQIKQGEQGARDRCGRLPQARRAFPPADGGCRAQVNRATRLLLAGQGDALTRKSLRAGTRQGSGSITAVP
jgi:hypothetical protein